MEEEELEDDHKGSGNKTKLKASDIYSDDSGSSDSAEEEEAKPTSQRRSSTSESRDSDSDNDKKLVVCYVLKFAIYQFNLYLILLCILCFSIH